jgi:hypothetical protein
MTPERSAIILVSIWEPSHPDGNNTEKPTPLGEKYAPAYTYLSCPRTGPGSIINTRAISMAWRGLSTWAIFLRKYDFFHNFVS